MTDSLKHLTITKKSGKENFHLEGKPVGFDLLSFWQWSTSDLVSNATRGILAEFIVAQAVGIKPDSVRAEWDPYDLETEDDIKIEVKSAAYLQSWHQERLSNISFSISRTKAWDAVTNHYEEEIKRQADVYVFALLAHKDKCTVDPLNLDQWQFFVLPTKELNERIGNQKSISLGRLKDLANLTVSFPNLKQAILEKYKKSQLR
jgi:hypothetical protein